MKRMLSIIALVAVFAVGCNSDAKKAAQYKASGDWANAQDYYIKAIKADPKNGKLHNELGFVYEKRMYYELAEKEYREAYLHKKGFMEAKYNLGSVLFKMRRFNEAIQEFEWIVKNDPGNAVAKNGLALSLHLSQGDLKRVEELYKQAIQIDPTNPTFHENLAKLYEQTNMKDKANEERQKAASLKNKTPQQPPK